MENVNEKDIDQIIDSIDDEKIINFYERSNKQAEELIDDEDKMERFLQKLEAKMKTVPLVGNTVLAYIPLMISLVRSYIKKEYTEPPITSIISVVVTLIYVLSPIDLMPDPIPGIGYIDDAVIIAGCLALVRTDLEDYRFWREENRLVFDNLPNYDEIMKEAKTNNKLFRAFFDGKKSSKKG